MFMVNVSTKTNKSAWTGARDGSLDKSRCANSNILVRSWKPKDSSTAGEITLLSARIFGGLYSTTLAHSILLVVLDIKLAVAQTNMH